MKKKYVPKMVRNYVAYHTVADKVLCCLSEGRSCMILGADGVGKTELAVQIIHQLKQDSAACNAPSGGNPSSAAESPVSKTPNKKKGISDVLFLTVWSGKTQADIFRDIGDYMSIPFNHDDPVTPINAALTGKTLLVVLDSAGNCVKMNLLRELNCTFLITTPTAPEAVDLPGFEVPLFTVADLKKMTCGKYLIKAAGVSFAELHAATGGLMLHLRLLVNTAKMTAFDADAENKPFLGDLIRTLAKDSRSGASTERAAVLLREVLPRLGDEPDKILNALGALAFAPLGLSVFERLLRECRIGVTEETYAFMEQLGLVNVNRRNRTVCLQHIVFYRFAADQTRPGVLLRTIKLALHAAVSETVGKKTLNHLSQNVFNHVETVVLATDIFGLDDILIDMVTMSAGYFAGKQDLLNAERFYRVGIKKTSQLRDFASAGTLCDLAGSMFHSAGDQAKTFFFWEKSLDFFLSGQQPSVSAATMAHKIARFALMEEQVSRAETYFAKADTILAGLQLDRARLALLMEAGVLLDDKQALNSALRFFHTAFDIAVMLDRAADECFISVRLAHIYERVQQFEPAYRFYRNTVRMLAPQTELSDVAYFNFKTGVHAVLAGLTPQAGIYLEKSAELFEKTGNRIMLTTVYGELGSLKFAAGNFPAALDYYERGLAAIEPNENEGIYAGHLANLGLTCAKNDQKERAREYWLRAAEMYRTLNSEKYQTILDWIQEISEVIGA